MRDFVEPTFGQRLLARLVDGLVILAAVGLVRAVVSGRAALIVGVVVSAVYENVLTVSRGQTLGKIVLRTEVIDRETGNHLSVGRSLARWAVLAGAPAIAALAVGRSLLTGLYDLIVLAPVLQPPLHLGIHDRLAGSIVTALPR